MASALPPSLVVAMRDRGVGESALGDTEPFQEAGRGDPGRQQSDMQLTYLLYKLSTYGSPKPPGVIPKHSARGKVSAPSGVTPNPK